MINGIIDASWGEKKLNGAGKEERGRVGCVSTLLKVSESERGGRRREKKRGREKRGGREEEREVEELSPRRAHAARGAARSHGSFGRSRCFIFRLGGGKGEGVKGCGEVRRDQERTADPWAPSAVRWQQGATAHQHSSERCLPSLSEVRTAVA